MRQQQVEAHQDEEGVNNQCPLPAPGEDALRFGVVRQRLGALLEIGKADCTEEEAQCDQHAAENLKRVQRLVHAHR